MGEFARHLAPYAGASAVEAREVGARLPLTHLSDNQVERRLAAVQNRGGRRRRLQRPARPPCLAAEPFDTRARVAPPKGRRSEDRRVGKEWVSTGKSRWAPDH